MGDLRFALLVICTMIGGYFNRDDEFEKYLDRFNDQFELEGDIAQRLQRVFDFVDECGFLPDSRVWRKADLFTLLIELDTIIKYQIVNLDPLEVVTNLQRFYSEISSQSVNETKLSGVYYKAALQASNDRINRVRRGQIIGYILRGFAENDIMVNLREQQLI